MSDTQLISNSQPITNINTNTTTQPTSDSCTTCIWLDKQPEGNSMLCIMPGACEWSSDGFNTIKYTIEPTTIDNA